MLPLHRQLRPFKFSVGRKYFLYNQKAMFLLNSWNIKVKFIFFILNPHFKLLILSEYKTKTYKVFEKNKI